MILATRTGTLTAIKVIRETKRGYVYNDLSMNGLAKTKERRLSKADPSRKIFANTDDALDWMVEVAK